LGAGAIAIAAGDSLYRVGPCEEGHYRLISEGPVRAVFELSFKNIPAGDRLYSLRHRISIYAGDRFYRNRIWIENLRGDEELVTGIVNLHAIVADTLRDDSVMIVSTLGNQGFNGELLGMGILFHPGQFKKYREAPDTGAGIVNTHLVSFTPDKDKPVEYCFLAAWELQEPGIKDKAYFEGLLRTAAKKYSLNPLSH
jgi:hypothetical protein